MVHRTALGGRAGRYGGRVIDLAMRPVRLACALRRGGARFVIVGGAARLLASGVGRPRDLDIVVDEADLRELVCVLGEIGILAGVASLARTRQRRLDSFWGPLDVFVEPPPPSWPWGVAGSALMVAA